MPCGSRTGAWSSDRSGISRLARRPVEQYFGITGQSDDSLMPRTKNEVLTIRTTTQVKALLKLAAERERRSAASMVEVLVLAYAKEHGLRLARLDEAQV